MRPFWKKMLSCAMAFVCLTGAAAGLTGCHGSKERAAFEVPENFDTTKQYEITFWAKKRHEHPSDGYLQKKRSRILRHSTRILRSI